VHKVALSARAALIILRAARLKLLRLFALKRACSPVRRVANGVSSALESVRWLNAISSRLVVLVQPSILFLKYI
jgi:hypothetical protein